MAEPVGWMRTLVFEARDAERLADFWQAVGGVGVFEREPGWLRLMPDRNGMCVAFEDPEPDGDGTLRFRPDIEVDDLEAARARVEALGGRLVKVIRAKPGEEHLRMADPEGNEFTLVLPDPVRPEGFHLR